MKQILYIFILAIIVSSCSDKIEQPVNSIEMNGKLVRIDSTATNLYPRWVVGNLTISKALNGKAYYTGSILDNNIMGKPEKIFSVGRGHNEFDMITLTKGKGNTLFLLNRPRVGNKLISLTAIENSDSIIDIKDYNNWKKYDLKKLPAFFCTSDYMLSLSDSTMLVLGAPYKAIGHIFSIINYKKQTVLPLEYWPDDENECDSLPKHSVYCDNAKIFSNGKGKFLYQCDRGRFSFIFSIHGNKIDVINNLYSDYPNYKSDDGQNYSLRGNKPERLCCSANNNNIYILLTELDKDGKKKENWESQTIYGNMVEVYDWNGNKQNTYHLDKVGRRIMVSENNKKLYLFEDNYDEDSNLRIWAFDI